jgi:hypothetical protein
MPVCDSCGAQVDDAHIRARIERLELGTRFRPTHVHTLLIDAAPPSKPQDYFYAVASNRSIRSVASRTFFDELMKCAGFTSDAAIEEETALAEFQRRGIFLAYAIECPIGESEELEAAVRKLAPTVLLRVRSSYKPKHVALLSGATRELIQSFSEAGWKDRLILDGGGPFDDPFLADPAGQAEFNTAFGDRLSGALNRIP